MKVGWLCFQRLNEFHHIHHNLSSWRWNKRAKFWWNFPEQLCPTAHPAYPSLSPSGGSSSLISSSTTPSSTSTSPPCSRGPMQTSGVPVSPTPTSWKAPSSSSTWMCRGDDDHDVDRDDHDNHRDDNDHNNDHDVYHDHDDHRDDMTTILIMIMIMIAMIMIIMLITIRMNHACLKIGNSIYVAGGVTTDNFDQRLVTKKVERLWEKKK